MKKHLKWIIPSVLALLLAAGAFAAYALGLFTEESTVSSDIDVYWNVDKNLYWDDVNKVSTRIKVDQYYRVRFAYGGEQIDLFVESAEIMDKIDANKFMGLRVDENNVVTEVVRFEDFSGGLAVYQYYVVEIQDGLLICNNLASGRGLPLKLRVNDKTQIYDVGGEGLLVGLPGEAAVGSQVYGVLGYDGYVSHLYVMPPFEPKPVYWNMDRQYDSSSKMSTRERDSLGYFNVDFAVEGKQVTLRTQSVDAINQIDSFAARCMHLEFDENGDITQALHAKFATGGATMASWYHVLRINSLEDSADINVVANGFYAEKFSGKDKGSTAECTLAENVQIYDVTGNGVPMGTPTELQLYDQVHCLTNPYGDVCVIFVVGRSQNVDLYYNLDRKWDSSGKVSTRTPDSNGWYHFEMSVNGKLVKLKTQDANVVYTIDERAAKVLGLTLDGDVITAVYKPGTVSGSEKTVFDYCDIVSIQDNTITCSRKGVTYIGVMDENTRIYNVSSTAAVKGEPTTLKEGDKLYGFSSFDGKLTTVYVVGRVVDGPVYWNLDRSYDSQKQQTNRKPAEDGYYYFKLFDGTKTVEYKTKSKALADKLDSYVAVALKRSGDVITEVYKYDSVKNFNGSSFASWKDISQLNGNTVVCKDSTRTYTGTMAADCVIYDVTQGSAMPVTKTTLQLGDRIHGMCNSDGQITAIYVVSRKVSAKLYYNVERKWNDTKQETTRTPDANGYYVFTMSVEGKHVELKTKSKDMANAIDSRAAKVLGIDASNGVINKIYKPSAVIGSETTVFDYAVITKIGADGTITAERNGKTYTGKMLSGCKIYDVSSMAKQLGETTTVRVGDTVYGLGPAAKQLKHIFVTNRTVDAVIYYNVVRKWENNASTRKPDADGYYVFTMAIDGKQVQLKTKDTDIVALIDGRAAKAVALKVKDGVILEAYKPSVLTACQNTIFDYTVITKIDADGTVTAERNGKTYTGKLSASCGIYDVSATAKTVGAKTTLRVGDTVYGLGKGSTINYVYVTACYAPSMKGHCEACDQEVTWKKWDGTSLSAGHWYLEEDVTVTKALSLAKDRTMCLNLNGKQLTGDSAVDRIFNIYGSFNLMDSAGGGKVVASYNNDQGKTGSVFYVQNSKANGVGTMNLYGGTLTATGTTKSGGIGGVAGVFTMYNGSLENGAAADGSGLLIESATETQVKLLGGSISGSQVFAKKTVILGGQVKISDLYLNDCVCRLEGLTGEASVTVTLSAGFGTVAENATEADGTRFVEKNGKQISYGDGKLMIAMPVVSHDDHCICGGLGLVGDHTCAETVPVWQPWTGSWTDGGYYYLTGDYTVTGSILIEEGKTLHLCLNGFDMIGAENVTRIFNIYGILNLCDHALEDGSYAGNVISNYSGTNTQTGRVFYVQNRTTAAFNMYGGNLSSNSATEKGGIGGSAKYVNLYAGTISGGIALTSGGNLQIDGGTTTIYGGTVSGGKSDLGGNINVEKGSLRVLGGTVTEGKAQTAGTDVYMQSVMTVGGSAEIGNVYLTSGKTMTVSDLADTASIGVTLADTYGAFATGAEEENAQCFVVDEGLTVEYQAGTLLIPDPNAPEAHTDHCVCGSLGQVGDHTCVTENPVWEAWTGTWESGKYYYLTQNYTVNKTILIEEGQTLNLCLNGFDMIGKDTVNRIFNVYGVVNICDHKTRDGGYAGDVINNYNIENGDIKTGGIFYVQNRTNAAFNLYGGNLSFTTKLKNGGIGGVTAAFNMYDGILAGNTVSGDGGVLYLEHNKAHVNLYGGTVSGGRATNGGNIYIKSGKVVLDGATVSGGYSSNAGGSIRVQDAGILEVKNGNITGGEAKGNGGNIYSLGTIIVTGGTITEGVVAAGKLGGNLYASGGSLSITDDSDAEGTPAITNGSAGTGGNIAIKVNATITGCMISGGSADQGGDIYFEKSGGTLNVSGCGTVTVYCAAGTVEGDGNVTVTNP